MEITDLNKDELYSGDKNLSTYDSAKNSGHRQIL